MSVDELYSIIKPWPFRGWAMDLIGIHHPFLKHHCFILVATDYFTKWVKAKPYKSIGQNEVISFIDDLIHRFSVPQTIIVDNGIAVEGGLVRTFSGKFGISIIKSTPYYT